MGRVWSLVPGNECQGHLAAEVDKELNSVAQTILQTWNVGGTEGDGVG